MKSTIVAILVTLAIATAADDLDSLRFVNAIEGKTLSIYTNEYDNPITLGFMESTSYLTIQGGVIQITNVLDQNGNALTNGNPIMITFGPHYTSVCINNNGFLMVLYNETAPASMDAAQDSSKAWIRMMDLGSAVEYNTLAYQAGAVFQYVGYLQTTAYVSIPVTTTAMRMYDPQTQTYNTPSLAFQTSFQSNTAYTVMFFTPTSGQTVVITTDRMVAGATQPSSTTGSNTGSLSTGDQTGSQTSSQTGQTQTGGVINNNETNGASSISTLGMVAFVASFLALLF